MTKKKSLEIFEWKKLNVGQIVKKVVKKLMWRKFGVNEQERRGVICDMCKPRKS